MSEMRVPTINESADREVEELRDRLAAIERDVRELAEDFDNPDHPIRCADTSEIADRLRAIFDSGEGDD